ncbi:MAG: hypothetical protein ABI321_12005 [Polyangia bacterium]
MKRALLTLTFVASCVAGVASCKKPVDTAPIAAEAAGLQQHENELLGRRGALQRERTAISQQRQQLLEKRSASGASPSSLDEEDKQLSAKEIAVASEQTAVDQKLDELLHARAELVQRATSAVQGAAGADPLEHAAHREQSVAEREKAMAGREADVAEREAKLALREAQEAKREKDTCSTVLTAVPVAAPPSTGKKYSAHDVDPVYKKALKIMQERGILAADLPPGTSKLIDETKAAMKSGDFMRAKYAADQLLGTVEEIKIDRNFISAKMGRLSSAMRGKKLEGDAGKNTDALLRDATAHYSDGRFADANQKINKLFAMLK